MADQTKKITGDIKLASQAIVLHEPATIQAFEGTDADGFFRYQKRLEDYIGLTVELEDVDLTGYDYVIKDVEGLYVRSEWVDNIVIQIFWQYVTVDTVVRVKQNLPDPWIDANFAEYDPVGHPSTTIAVWDDGRNEHTALDPGDITWFVYGELA